MPPRWSDIEDRLQAVIVTSKNQEDFDDICARVLTSTDGRQFLRQLYQMYVDTRARHGASEAELREAEAKRSLVFDLEKARDSGLRRATQPKKTA